MSDYVFSLCKENFFEGFWYQISNKINCINCITNKLIVLTSQNFQIISLIDNLKIIIIVKKFCSDFFRFRKGRGIYP